MAISEDKGVELVMQHDRSVDKVKFENFLKLLHQKIGKRSVYLVLDNLSVHTCDWSKHWMAHLDFKWAFNAPYFPDGNPIEFVFSIAKHNFKKAKLQAIANKKPVVMADLINRAFRKITKKQVKKCV